MDSKNQQKKESKKLLSDFLLSLEEKGKMCFILKDLESLGRSVKSLRMSLWRLSEKNRIVSPGSDFFVIVPVQYRKVGSPPALWYLNDWMKFICVDYYVGLLSAAAIHGASHQAVQETEVIVGRQIDNRTIDRIRFRFFYRKNVSNTPTQKWEVPTGYVFVSTPAALKIRCGEWDTQKQSEPYKHQDRSGLVVKIHPEFNPKNLANDFALVFLSADFILDFHIDTMCLPQPNEQYNGQVCFATGWGKDKFGADGVYQVVLKEVDLQVVNPIECQDKLRLTRLGKRFNLDNSFMCAGGLGGKDTCKGDGGSPLVCSRKYDPQTYDQAGIVAWGIGCGQDGTPGVYADVSKAVCWIDSAITCHLGKISGDFNSYFGNTRQACAAWFDAKFNELDAKSSAGGPEAAIFGNIKQQYKECQVNWLNTGKEAIIGGGDGSYADPAKSAGEYVDPAKSAGEYVDPAKSAGGYVDPTKSAQGYVDPTKAAGSY